MKDILTLCRTLSIRYHQIIIMCCNSQQPGSILCMMYAYVKANLLPLVQAKQIPVIKNVYNNSE
jgi:hypothetical protein